MLLLEYLKLDLLTTLYNITILIGFLTSFNLNFVYTYARIFNSRYGADVVAFQTSRIILFGPPARKPFSFVGS